MSSRQTGYPGGGTTKDSEGYHVSSDVATARGQITGIKRGRELYGQDIKETGKDVQDIKRMREENLYGDDPVSTYLRQSANRQIRQARASAGAAGRTTAPQEAQIRRSAESDIGAQMSQNRSAALGEYQSLIGNVARNLQSLELGWAGVEKSGQYQPPPAPRGGITVICTELHRQGYMPDSMLEKDAEYGRNLRVTDPDIYSGYILLATPVVALMKKSKVFTYLISIPGMRWAKWMAGDNNKVGKNIDKYGKKLCNFAWKVKKGVEKWVSTQTA